MIMQPSLLMAERVLRLDTTISRLSREIVVYSAVQGFRPVMLLIDIGEAVAVPAVCTIVQFHIGNKHILRNTRLSDNKAVDIGS